MPSSMLSRAFPWPALSGAVPLFAVALGLSGCGGDGPKFAPACPQTGILGDAADLTSFRNNSTDLTDMLVDARITGVNGKCSSPDPGHLRTVLSVNMELARGPAMQARTADITYFVAASRGDTILDKRDYTIRVGFERNGGRVRVTGDDLQIDLPTPGKVTGSDYRVLIGFQLTPEQLAYNRKRGPR